MRLGINVPNELLQRVKSARPDVNVSQICREALEKYARSAERVVAQVAVDQLDDHFARLAESDLYPLLEPDWTGMALEDARNWVLVVSIKDWTHFCHQRDVLEKNGRGHEDWHAEEPLGGEARGYLDRRREFRDWFIHQYELDIDSTAGTTARDEYCRAWIAYVNEVRRLVELHQQGERERLTTERKEKWQSLPEPEVPPQLLE